MPRTGLKLFLAPSTILLSAGCSHPQHIVETPSAMKDVRCLSANGPGDQVGCWILGRHPITEPADRMLYWHIYEFPSVDLAGRASDEHSALIEAYGHVYLMAVTVRGWTPDGGRRVAVIGPMQTALPVPHTATFLQTWLVPGMQTRVHRHDGPEALLILSGEQCVETPGGSSRSRAGEQLIVKAQTPMVLYAEGSGRRALAVIIHPTDRPLSHVHDWLPTGACLTH